MEWEFLMNGSKVITIKRLFSNGIDLFNPYPTNVENRMSS